MDLKEFVKSRGDYFKNILTPPENWNRIIDLSLKAPSKLNSAGAFRLGAGYDGGENFTIKTPRTGRKPNIEISGQLTAKDYVADFEVRITNLYLADKILSDYHEIEVTAGYEGSMSAGLSGTILNIYNESPGPDKVTVIQCASASFNKWINATVNLELDENFKLSEAIDKITKALDFDEAFIDNEIQSMTSPTPLKINGSAKQAIVELEKLFPDTKTILSPNRISVYPKEGKTNGKNHQLPLLIQAPQFSGGVVNLIAPWRPEISPGDTVTFSTNYYSTQTIDSSKIGNTAEVVAIDFNFSTNGANEMHITGTVK